MLPRSGHLDSNLAIMEAYSTYQTPLSSRYASKEMAHLFSPAKRFSTWRKLWLYLATAEKELGLPIPDDAIEQMKANLVRPGFLFPRGAASLHADAHPTRG